MQTRLVIPVQEEYLRGLGAGTILGGEFVEVLAILAARLDHNRNNTPNVSFPARLRQAGEARNLL